MTVVFSCYKIGKSKSPWKSCKHFEKGRGGCAVIPVDRCVLSYIWCFVACQDPQSMKFSRKDYWGGLPLPTPGDLPDSEIKPLFLASPALAGIFFTTAPPGKLWQMWAQSLRQWPHVGHSMVTNLTASAGDAGLIPGLGRSSGGGNGYPSPLF